MITLQLHYELHDKTVEKEKRLSQGFNVSRMWECQFHKQIKENKEINNFVNQSNVLTPLEPRNAFYERRTYSFKLFENAN